MQLMGLKRLPHSLQKGCYCRQKGFKTIKLPQQTTDIVMEGVEVKYHLHKGYEKEGHKCVEVTMVEEPQHCFCQIHSYHEIVMAWWLRS
jgi:hypothetical protein